MIMIEYDAALGYTIEFDGERLTVYDGSPVRHRRAMTRLMGMRHPAPDIGCWTVDITFEAVACITELKTCLDHPELDPQDVEATYDRVIEDILNKKKTRHIAASSILA